MSEKQDFSEIGERIRNALQDAVESGDFGQINNIVNDTVGGAMEEVRRQVNQVHDRLNRPFEGRERGAVEQGGAEGGGYDYASRYRSKNTHYPRRTMYASQRQAERARTAAGGRADAQTPSEGADAQLRTYNTGLRPGTGSRYFNRNGRVAGILFTVFGSIGLGFFGLVALGILIALIVEPGLDKALVTFLFLALTGGCGILLGKGCGLQGRLKRAERYMRLAGQKMYLEIEDLAARTGQSVRRVRKDVKGMLNAGIFPEGHMDAQEKMLVLNEETWQQYLLTQKEWKNRQALEQEQRENDVWEEGTDLTAEQQIEREGRSYMERLRQLNVEIPGEVISNKLYQLDYLLQRIFMVLKEHPEKCPQMRKFMDYYLPTTVKLVESYAEFDKAGVQGDNIKSAKAEIEKTMDTINQAFEKLLDDMYQDEAFEAAADAQVLKTVLAQDGYMKSEFTANREEKREE